MTIDSSDPVKSISLSLPDTSPEGEHFKRTEKEDITSSSASVFIGVFIPGKR